MRCCIEDEKGEGNARCGFCEDARVRKLVVARGVILQVGSVKNAFTSCEDF